MSRSLTHAKNVQIIAPNGTIALEKNPKRIRAVFAGHVIADSTDSIYVFEQDHLPAYYIPFTDVNRSLLRPVDTHTVCPRKGTASYYDIVVGDRRSSDAVWTYPRALPDAVDLSEYVSFYWDRVDAWYEEDEQVFVHARDPYVRVDVLQSSRRVEVYVGDELVADTHHPKILFETGLPPRYYIPRIDVQNQLFTATDTSTACPYKGNASYVSHADAPDIAWFYPQTTAEASGIENHLSFYPERAKIVVDGVQL